MAENPQYTGMLHVNVILSPFIRVQNYIAHAHFTIATWANIFC